MNPTLAKHESDPGFIKGDPHLNWQNAFWSVWTPQEQNRASLIKVQNGQYPAKSGLGHDSSNFENQNIVAPIVEEMNSMLNQIKKKINPLFLLFSLLLSPFYSTSLSFSLVSSNKTWDKIL